MKPSELRTKSLEELNKELHDLNVERFNLRMQKGTGQMPKPHLFRKVKNDIARIKTILKEKSV